MDVQTITTLIGSMGFPCAMCILIFYYMIKQNENHKEEMDKLTQALNNNTIAITKLQDRLEAGKNG